MGNSSLVSEKYPDTFSVSRHRRNQGRLANFDHWHSQLTGDYHIGLASDDALHPTCIEATVKALETHKNHCLHYIRPIDSGRGGERERGTSVPEC